jgi:putative tryptophan/tyrosine transport system substrate-binding protein
MKTVVLLIGFIFASIHFAEAQQPKKVLRIGILFGGRPSAVSDRLEAFRQALSELGYAEGKNIVIETRYAEGKVDQLPALASELVRLNPDVIVTGGPQSTRSAKNATSTIPIVMGQDSDPVGSGFVASLARPGGNITGLSNFNAELGGKRLELVKKIVPKLSRMIVIGTSTEPANALFLKEAQLGSVALGIKLQYVDVRGTKDLEAGFLEATKERVDAVLVLAASILFSQRTKIADLAVKRQIPAMYISREFVEDGGLMSYGTDPTDSYRRVAIYVDKILKGAKPADIPIEQPTKFELAINFKTAKQIGITIPQKLLARADRVIK